MATAKAVVEIARKELGYTEGRNNDNKYGIWYGMNHQPWCNIFLCWCFAQAGAANLIPRSASVGVTMRWFLSHSYEPIEFDKCMPGDIVMYSSGSPFRPGQSRAYRNDGHIEMITEPGLDRYGRVVSIGGNTGGGIRVAEHAWATNKIYYIFRPHFDPEYILGADSIWKLGNIISINPAGRKIGQVASGLDNSKCIRVRTKDSTGKVRHIQHIVQTDNTGNPHWISKRLIQLNNNNQYTRKVLAGQYEWDSTIAFNHASAFQCEIQFNFYRPHGYKGEINILNHTDRNGYGWKFYINKDDKLAFYIKNITNIESIKIIDNYKLNSNSTSTAQPGEYYNSETNQLEWKDKAGNPLPGYPQIYIIGESDYNIRLNKNTVSSEIEVYINNSLIGTFNFNDIVFNILTNTANVLKVGDYHVKDHNYYPITFISCKFYIYGISPTSSPQVLSANCDNVQVIPGQGNYLPTQEA